MTATDIGRKWQRGSHNLGRRGIKIASMNGTVTNYAPEYEDCRRIAVEHRCFEGSHKPGGRGLPEGSVWLIATDRRQKIWSRTAG